MFKKLRRPLDPLYRTAILAFLWSNRRDVSRWTKFGRRVSTRSTRPRTEDLKLELRVRASLSADPILRTDPSIRDLRVRDGIVVLETPPAWNNRSLAVARIRQVKGVEAVHTASDCTITSFLDIDLVTADTDPTVIHHT